MADNNFTRVGSCILSPSFGLNAGAEEKPVGEHIREVGETAKERADQTVRTLGEPLAHQ